MKQLLVAAGVMSAMTFAQADIYEFDLWTGGLSGAQEVPANTTTATGGEVGDGITYDTTTRLLQVNVAYGLFGYSPLEGNYSASHIHVGAIGVGGPVIVDLKPIQFSLSAKYGFFQGSVAIPEQYEANLLSDTLYINIHSTKYAGGEIRAQLMVIPEPSTMALLGVGMGGLWFCLRRKA